MASKESLILLIRFGRNIIRITQDGLFLEK
jgi:hypothetical protein